MRAMIVTIEIIVIVKDQYFLRLDSRDCCCPVDKSPGGNLLKSLTYCGFGFVTV